MKHLAVIIAVLLVPLVALAQASAPVVVPDDVAGLIKFFQDTHQSKAYALLVGGAITVLVRLLTLLKPLAEKLPPEKTKWLAMGLALLGSAATGLLAGVAWYRVILDGVSAGMAALGGWEFVLKPLLDKLGLSTAPTGPVKQ